MSLYDCLVIGNSNFVSGNFDDSPRILYYHLSEIVEFKRAGISNAPFHGVDYSGSHCIHDNRILLYINGNVCCVDCESCSAPSRGGQSLSDVVLVVFCVSSLYFGFRSLLEL